MAVVGVTGDDLEEAGRVFKKAKNGVYESIEEMTPRELGLLYLYYPWALPDVDPTEEAA